MNVTRDEAAAALSDIEATTRRGALLRGYKVGGPILMMWSVIWAAGYTAMGLLPENSWMLIWLPLDIVGVVATILLARGGPGPVKAEMQWRMIAGSAAAMAFAIATAVVFQPRDPAAYVAFPGLLIAFIYTAVGLFGAPRYLLIGAFMFAVTLVGFFAFREFLPFWMAAASAGLFVSGVWLWRS